MKFSGDLFVVLPALFHITFCSKVFETKIDRLNQNLETVEGLARGKGVEQDVDEHDDRALTERNGRYTIFYFLIEIFHNIKDTYEFNITSIPLLFQNLGQG